MHDQMLRHQVIDKNHEFFNQMIGITYRIWDAELGHFDIFLQLEECEIDAVQHQCTIVETELASGHVNFVHETCVFSKMVNGMSTSRLSAFGAKCFTHNGTSIGNLAIDNIMRGSIIQPGTARDDCPIIPNIILSRLSFVLFTQRSIHMYPPCTTKH